MPRKKKESAPPAPYRGADNPKNPHSGSLARFFKARAAVHGPKKLEPKKHPSTAGRKSTRVRKHQWV